jgi:23S rRNA (guanosine2251-2'-O)-methyltransferase
VTVKNKRPETIVVLDNIRSTHNVGSIFRTSDALDISKLILCGTTPTPKDRFGRDREDVAKVSLGAEKNIDWEYFPKTLWVVKKLKKEGYKIIMIEQSDKSVDYKKVKIAKNSKVAFVLGTEVEGLSKSLLKLADVIAEIPMLGNKESLNVSVAFGVAMFRMLGV